MARQRHLENAPIIEAIIDITVKPRPSIEPKVFVGIPKELSRDYPGRRKTISITSELDIASGQSIKTEKSVIGYRYTSIDKKYIAQLKVNGFTFSRLSPYPSWVKVRSEANRFWRVYLEKSRTELITRIAVRYINIIPIVIPCDFDEYFTASPKIPPKLPQETNGFLSKIGICSPEKNQYANVVLAMHRSSSPNQIKVALDIEVFRKVEIPSNDKGLWKHFEALRNFKNKIFFNYITEKTARMFE